MSFKEQARKDLQTKINNLRIEASRLENQTGLGAREAVAAVDKAAQLRKQADHFERNQHAANTFVNERVGELQTADRQKWERGNAAFSQMQNEALQTELVMSEAINTAYDALVYNTAVDVPVDMQKRVIGKLLLGQGSKDANGNQFIDFSFGKNAPTYRAIATPDGQMGIITTGMGMLGGSADGGNGGGE